MNIAKVNANQKVNVNQRERIVSAMLGGALLLLPCRSLIGKVLAIVLLYRAVRGHCYFYQALGLNTADRGQLPVTEEAAGAPEIERSITIEKPADELYRLWRDPQTLSQVMGEFVDVREVGKDRLHWLVRAPFVQPLEWDTQVVEDRPGEILRWKSLEGARLSNEGSLRFRPAPRDWGTEATLHLRFDLPGGVISNNIAKSLGFVPRLLAEKALRRFKSLAETGEITSLKHNPSARASTNDH